MQISMGYSIQFPSETDEKVVDDMLVEVMEDIEAEAEANASYLAEINDYVVADGPLIDLESFEFAIIGVSEYPREMVVYDYWKCVHLMILRDKMTMTEAINALDIIVAGCTDEGDPIFVQTFDWLAENDNNDLDEAA
jgi:hypothetical protein